MIQFVVIDQPSQLASFAVELESFFQLYLQNFPDPDEREEPDTICERIRSGALRPELFETTILLCLSDDKIAGGAVLEYYTSSSCFLLTYIFVDKDLRGKQIARCIVESGVKMVVESRGTEAKAIFFESNIPWETDKGKDSFDAWDRYRVFARLGAKWIDIDYTQPALSFGKKRVNHLHLFLIPSLTNLRDKLEKSVLISFLTVFYKALSVNAPEDDPDFIRMTQSITGESSDEYLVVKEMPGMEQDDFRFRDISVAFHFDQEPQENRRAVKPGEMPMCPIIGSYEFDLFKYRYQQSPPYKSYCINELPELKCVIRFPEFTRFVSEGRHETLKNPVSEINVEVKLNYTSYGNGRRVWTMVFIPRKGDYLYQDQVIKLISLFSCSSEQNNIRTGTSFLYNKMEFKSLEALAREITKDPKLRLLDSGVVQTDFSTCTSNLPGPETWKEAIEAICLISKQQASAYAALEKRYLEDKAMQSVLNLICGFSLGIFDYPRMSFEEVMDTIIPHSFSGNSFVLMNKGILNSLNFRDEIYLRTRTTTGICPYLLISSSVLAFNHVEATIAENRLDMLLESRSAAKTSLPVLIEHRKILEKKINEEILTNVFHYPTEQQTYLQGMSHRGIDDRIQNIKNRLNELIQLIKDKDAKQKSKYDKMGLILLAVISILSLEPVFNDIYQSVAGVSSILAWVQKDAGKWIIFLGFTFSVFLLVRYFVMKSIKDS